MYTVKTSFTILNNESILSNPLKIATPKLGMQQKAECKSHCSQRNDLEMALTGAK